MKAGRCRPPESLAFVNFDMSANSPVQWVDRNVYGGLGEFLSTSEASHDTIQTAYSIDCASVFPGFRTVNGSQHFLPSSVP